MKTKVIVINGLSRSGKGSFVNFIRNKVAKIYEHSTIKKVKMSLEGNLMIYPGRKTEKEREFLMSVKQAWIKYNNGPFNEVIERVEKTEAMYLYMNNVQRILFFVDVRETEEIKKLADHFGEDFRCVWVDRKEVKPQPGDSDVNAFPYDFVVKNHGNLTDLNKESSRFIEYLNKEFK